MESECHGILGEEDIEVRVQPAHRFELDLEAEYHSPELSHDDLAMSDVPVEDKTKKDGVTESVVTLEDEADNHGVAVPLEDTSKRDGLAESNILVGSTTMKGGMVELAFLVEDASNKDGIAVSNVLMEDKAKKVGLTESNSHMELSEHNLPVKDMAKKHGQIESNAAMELIGNNASSEDAAKKDELIENDVSSEDAAKKDGLIESNIRIEDASTKVGLTKSNGPRENTAKKVGLRKSNVPMENKCIEDGRFEFGLEFESEEKAYDFYNGYAGKVGFSVRKDWLNKSKNGIVQSRRYCCSKEGYRRKDPRDKCLKNPSKETRTGCLAHMIISLQPNGKYRVIQLEATHNHELVSADKAHLLKSQRKLAPAQVARVDEEDTFGMPPMDRHERLLIPVKMLKQVADVYTPAIFEMFKEEFIRSLDYVVNLFSEDGTVTDYKITGDGIPREHVRWTKDAKVGTVKDGHTCALQVDLKFDLLWRYKNLCHKIASIATRAAETEESFTFAAFYLDKMLHGVEGTLRRTYRNVASFCESEYAENLCIENVDSSSENVESLLNQIICQKDSTRLDDADGEASGRFETNSAESSSRSKQSLNLPPVPSTVFNNPCSPQAYYPIRAPRTLLTRGSYGFEENPLLGLTSISHDQGGGDHHMFLCTYQPDFSFMHQPSHNPAMNQLPDSSTNQHVFPSCIQFPQDLARE
ncbi:hypothetical protein NE237_013642 [Protea cynaroides]|uniref:FAR1 domain-containing protein n=1 Tax=Protea cynaroides TaxID=273540 RepID=A0A9Q0H4A5_9MAGN|nr:hypothetical protein NE237_013642 [Protea cynaroides]